jgi:hypothetical protein
MATTTIAVAAAIEAKAKGQTLIVAMITIRKLEIILCNFLYSSIVQ